MSDTPNTSTPFHNGLPKSQIYQPDNSRFTSRKDPSKPDSAADSPLSDPNAFLTQVVVRFDTTNDDKDGDTILSVSLDGYGKHIAEIDGVGGHWDNGSTNSVTLFNDYQVTRAQLQATPITIHIHIEPNGNDTWDYNCSVQLIFSDGTQVENYYPGHWLSQDNKDNTYAVAIP
jgi:hypothetical protein